MGQDQHNFVVINGKKYSVETGKLLDLKPPKLQQSPVQVRPVATLTSHRPTDIRRTPQQIGKHPNHTDLSKISLKQKVHDPLSHKAEISSTSTRPKSMKIHGPATKVHEKVKIGNTSEERIKQPNLPKISQLSAPQLTANLRSSAENKPKITLGDTKQQARRLRAAQHRKNNQISKFAEARRSHEQLAKAPVIEQEAPEQLPVQNEEMKLQIEQKIAAIQAAKKAKISSHHPLINQFEPQTVEQTVQPKEDKKRFSFVQKIFPAAAASLSVVLVVGYITYLNIPNFAMKVAASRAGFEATLPAYTPDGFGFDGPVAYDTNQVVVDFTSNTDDRTYQVAQQESRWDSQSLLENVVKEETDKYLTFEEKGLTIYIYDGNNATWVNRGILYSIEGDSKLNTEQILKIATSL